MEKDNGFLGVEPVGKLLFRLAIPTIAAQLINMLYNIVDRIYIGHMPGSGDLALTGGCTLQSLNTTGWICLLIVGLVHTGVTYCLFLIILAVSVVKYKFFNKER